MKHTVTWISEKKFMGVSASGHAIVMDVRENAPSPMELCLLALAGCTGIDVVNILKKMKQPLEKLTIEVTAEQAEEYPKVFTKIHLVYKITGDVEERKARRAVELSKNTYCSVGAMLEKSATITYELMINKGGSYDSGSSEGPGVTENPTPTT